ncbi:MAG: HEAT repeat domain-containing protein [Gemmatimonadota bacterium]|nr:MAG: HEAT repeat domain-containing protein [Gemmatimonadota bacterium]
MDENVLGGLPDFDSDFESDVGPATDPGTEAVPVAEEGGLDTEVREFLTAFVKTVRAAQLYVQGNPLLHQFIEDLKRRLNAIWDRVPSLNLTVYESEIRWLDSQVYQEKLGGQDNLAFNLYRDGIRRVELLPGVEDDELRQFIDVLRLSKTLKEDEDDLLTLLWNCDFSLIRYEYVDVLGDEPPVPVPDLSQADDTLPALPELELSPELQTPTLREDFEPSLYFLDEADVAHLQQELLREWDRPVRQDVTVAVLDQYELGDEERRAEVVDMLRQMLPRVLAEGDFAKASFIVGELKGIAVKKQEDAAVIEEVDAIIGELSEPIVLEQLVKILEDGTVDPNSEALATLLGALKPQAIIVLIQALPLVARKEAREQLMATLDRLASINPKLMPGLVTADDPRVAAEAAKIAGRLKMSGTAEPISGLLKRPEQEVRLAAVEALVALRTSMAGSPLMGALTDESRDVRVAAAKGIARLKYSPGAQQLEGYIKGNDLRKRDLTEQLAFFEAYARAAGDKGTRLLARMLNGRRYLWFKYPSQMRACAARALGLVGGAEAEKELNVAEFDKDPMVLSAVHAARREPPEEGESDDDGNEE